MKSSAQCLTECFCYSVIIRAWLCTYGPGLPSGKAGPGVSLLTRGQSIPFPPWPGNQFGDGVSMIYCSVTKPIKTWAYNNKSVGQALGPGSAGRRSWAAGSPPSGHTQVVGGLEVLRRLAAHSGPSVLFRLPAPRWPAWIFSH